ncbi:ribosome-recycling factor, mitochondrial isoform X1 [Cuculus canorus]|uniref:ribosome-recycling factor, mitochondrial isoform X1 n=1 Tax=Cuculus canorus TaxID=55661 RepID=UPI0023AA64C5|nr:ribosome-recycling factor, mitochondrial isoform X1 [Cuculus canorus]XP_053940050.1 ribosome-recycling factor, mitochondrial isoform X1 [Cuculus canorus]
MATALRCVRHVPSLLYRSWCGAVRRLPQAPAGCPASLLDGCGQRVQLVLLARQLATKKAKGKGQAPAKVNISATLVEDIINLEETNEDMQAVIEALKEDFSRNLSVRTSPGALDHIIVMTRDGKFPLNQLGQISQKSPQLIVVNMTNFPESTAAAAKAIRESGMNLNPEVDGTIIRVPIPNSRKVFMKEYTTERCGGIARITAGVQKRQTNRKLRDNTVSAEVDSFVRGGMRKVKSSPNCPCLLLKTLFSLTYHGCTRVVFYLVQVQLCFST